MILWNNKIDQILKIKKLIWKKDLQKLQEKNKMN